MHHNVVINNNTIISINSFTALQEAQLQTKGGSKNSESSNTEVSVEHTLSQLRNHP